MKSLIAECFSRAAFRYDLATPVQQQSAEKLFELLQVHLEKNQVLLDIGVGTGRLLHLARQYFGSECQLHGIDFAPQMLAQARLNFPDAKLYCLDAENGIYPPKYYNLIVSNFALQWCTQPVLLLQKLYNSLQIGGQIAIALPLRNSLNHLAQLIKKISAETLALYPLPTRQDFYPLQAQIPNLMMQEQEFFVDYPNPYAALMAIKNAGANTTPQKDNKPLSIKTLKLLRQQKSFTLDYKVLFILAKRT